LITLAEISSASANDTRPAKQIFGTVATGSAQSSEPIGFYSKGCQSGAVQMPYDGPNWQAMRLSRNRRWGQPQLISLLEQLSRDAAAKDGWPGLLVGDIAQPRGGPMITGHASHQIGLDADIWLTPMPGRRLTASERENLSAVSTLQKNARLTVDPKVWTPAHARLVIRAASYPQVERIFVNPAIKKKLCETWTGDRTILGKVRPYYGHDYHFHIRLKCPPGTATCKEQSPPPDGDGCGKALDWWFSDAPWRKPAPPKPGTPPVKPRVVTVGDLPNACQSVLGASSKMADDNMGVPVAALASAPSEEGVPVTTIAAADPAPTTPAPAAPAPSGVGPAAVSSSSESEIFTPLPDQGPHPLSRPLK